MLSTQNSRDLHLAFDVGHSSIGWAVLQAAETPELLGAGVVTFGADDCLASKRRDYRRQRRHTRSIRQRVARMEKLLAHLGALSADELKAKHRQAGGDSAPWLLAARVLASNGAKETLLTWTQLWDVLRWYAHNRGYDGNRRWSSADAAERDDPDAKADAEKEQKAIDLMKEHGTSTMAETMVRVLGLDLNGAVKSSRIRFKAQNAAFPRMVVEKEVRRILEAHHAHLPAIDDKLVAALFTDWRSVPVPNLALPARYQGGLLFGQLVPRFDNRIIATCPISGGKVPSKNTREFLRYRWARHLNNVRVASAADPTLRPLSIGERKQLDSLMHTEGALTKKQFTEAVRALSGIARDNLDTLLMHPDAEEALRLDEVTKLTRGDRLKTLWPALAPRVQKRARDLWSRGRALPLSDLRALAEKLGESTAEFDATLGAILDRANTRKTKKDSNLTRESLLAEKFSTKKLSGRAPYARPLLARTYEEVMAGRDPTMAGGCLYLGEEKRREQLHRRVEEQTNNHLVRHRLLILERLLRDLIAAPEFAAGDRSRIVRLTIEVNRDLREMSGKTAEKIKQELGRRLANHGSVVKKLETAFAEQTFNGRPVEITAGLIRKARVAEDLGWTCPYTGQNYEPIHLVSGVVDKDHIIPRSLRPSDSLDSLVITFSEINRTKGQRTAWQFVQEEQGRLVAGRDKISIRALANYRQWVEGLETYKGHDDDQRRKLNRKRLLLLPSYEEKTFTPRDLTITSQLVRLGAQALQKFFVDLPSPPVVVSMPGAVTGAVRRSWNLLGTLSLAAPLVMESDGAIKTKTDIRDITHLHHALDACVLAYASLLLPRDGGLWELMTKRNPNDSERALLRATGFFDFDASGRFGLRDLPDQWKEQIRQKLAEKRIVQHVPSDMGGLRTEENTRGIVKVENDRVHLRQRSRDLQTGEISVKCTDEPVDKVLGLAPANGTSKLQPLHGVRVITDNYGVAILDHAAADTERFAIIPWHKIWFRRRELTIRNGGRPPRILRNGQIIRVPRGKFTGVWRVFSAKNNASGMALDIGWPDVVRLKNKTVGHKINVLLASLLRDGLEILRPSLAGIPVGDGSEKQMTQSG